MPVIWHVLTSIWLNCNDTRFRLSNMTHYHIPWFHGSYRVGHLLWEFASQCLYASIYGTGACNLLARAIKKKLINQRVSNTDQRIPLAPSDSKQFHSRFIQIEFAIESIIKKSVANVLSLRKRKSSPANIIINLYLITVCRGSRMNTDETKRNTILDKFFHVATELVHTKWVLPGSCPTTHISTFSMSYICSPLSSLYIFQYNTSWANDGSVTICHYDANLFSLFSVITNKYVTPEPFASCMMTHVKAFNEFVCMFGISAIDFFYWFLAFTHLF